MSAIASLVLNFPLILFVGLLGLLALYWGLVGLGLAPAELFERDSLRDDTLASALVSLGFAGVPASLALTLLVLWASGVALVAELAVLRWLPLGVLRIPVGVAVVWGAFALASPLAAGSCRRLHRRIHPDAGRHPRCLLGERVRVTAVDEAGADAEVVEDPRLTVRLRGKARARPSPGEVRVLVKYLRGEEAYRSVAEADYLDARTRLVRLHLLSRHRPDTHGRGENGSTPSA